MRTEELGKSQLAYRDSEGNLMILPMNDDEVRGAFIRRLVLEHLGERSVDQLLERFKQAAKDVKEGNTKSIDNIDKNAEEASK